MALHSGRIVYRSPLRILAVKIIKYQNFLVHQSTDNETGVLDDFTTDLMQRKSSKWERKRSFVKLKMRDNESIITDSEKTNQENDIENINIDTINLLFQKAIYCDNTPAIIELIKTCIKHNKVPSLYILQNVLSHCAHKGDSHTIREVSCLCEKVQPEILNENSNFEHYIAKAVWIKGDIMKSLHIFKSLYKENFYIRGKIRHILKHLILNSVNNHSEAMVINLLSFSDELVKEYNDYYVMGVLWQACFLSEWFSDQQIAIDLVKRHKNLCQVVLNKLPFIIKVSLGHHRTEIVYRLTEVLIKDNRESEVGLILLALLDYCIQQGDFKQFKEIIVWSIENNVKIPTIVYSEKLLELLEKDYANIRTKLQSNIPIKPSSTNYKF